MLNTVNTWAAAIYYRDVDMNKNKYNTDFIKEQCLADQGYDYSDWFLFRDFEHFGPFKVDQIEFFLKEGWIQSIHHLWRPGFDQWKTIDEIHSFAHLASETVESSNISDAVFKKNLKKDPNKIKAHVASDDHNRLTDNSEVKKKSIKVYALIASLIIPLMFYIGFKHFNDNNLDVFNKLSANKQKKLKSIAASPKSNLAFSFEALMTKKEDGEPVFIFATNLKKGAQISYKITGVEGTLVDRNRLNLNYNKVVNDSAIFESRPLRLENGAYLPSGDYNLSVFCVSCETKKAIFEDKYSLRLTTKEDYEKKLSLYNQKVKVAAEAELKELESLFSMLKKQYEKTSKNYLNSSKWNRSSESWLRDQNQLIDIFSQLESSEITEKIYFIELYKSAQDLTKKVFELHLLQEKSLNMKKNNNQQVADFSKSVGLDLKLLSSNIDMMRINLAKNTNQAPSKKGLIL